MKSPCVDCAFRPGSPEHAAVTSAPPEDTVHEPFYCHHGAHLDDDGRYQYAAFHGRDPVGYFVCAGWWQTTVEGKPLPTEPYRAPKGQTA
jgi:hypothetical protein